MQKILFVSSKNLTGNLLDGAEIRMYQIMKSLSEKNDLDFVCVDSNSSKKNERDTCNGGRGVLGLFLACSSSQK